MPIWISILLSLVLAWTCSNYARRLGLNPTPWLIAGALFGLLALLALMILAARKPLRKPLLAASSAPKPLTPTALTPAHAEKFWYYLNESREQLGPMSFNALSRAWNEGVIRELTYVWNEEMENWQHFKDVIALQQHKN